MYAGQIFQRLVTPCGVMLFTSGNDSGQSLVNLSEDTQDESVDFTCIGFWGQNLHNGLVISTLLLVIESIVK